MFRQNKTQINEEIKTEVKTERSYLKDGQLHMVYSDGRNVNLGQVVGEKGV